MDIGLFLDVDNTLTEGYIQQQFAKLLGVEQQWSSIESDFQNDVITPSRFGERLIHLFNDAGFTDDFVESNWQSVRLASYTDDLMALPVTKYLVSAGPSYFVSRFAKKYGIPDKNVLCSKYEFSAEGKLASCKAVSTSSKVLFLTGRRGKHFLTIGVGDNEKQDAPFVLLCDVPIFTTRVRGAFLRGEY